MKIPFRDLAGQYESLKQELDDAVARVLRSGSYINGDELASFEREFASYLGVRNVVGVNSGTDALVLALRALGIGHGDEVIVPTYTFLATAQAVCLAGATPRFADCAEDSFNVDVTTVERAFGKNVKAVIPVHLFGQAVDSKPIEDFCAENGLHLIEDAAQSIGARYRDRRVGAHGIAGAFSFYPTKNLGAFGDGGAISCDDDGLAARLRRLRNHGLDRGEHHGVGYNSRLDEIQAAVLRVKLRLLDTWNARRRVLAQCYRTGLAPTQCRLPGGLGIDDDAVYHHFVVIHPKRDALRRFLAENGVETALYYAQPCHRYALFSKLDAQALPVAERWSRESLALPIYPEQTEASVWQVCQLVRQFEGD